MRSHFVVFVVALAACHRPSPEPSASNETERSGPPAPLVLAPSRARGTAPSATSAPVDSKAARAAKCPVHLDSVSFMECNPHPTQSGYPECWNYWINPTDEGEPCLPKEVDVFVTGWQGISDQRRAQITYEGDPPVRAKLVQKGPDESELRDTVGGKSPDLGTLSFDHGTVSELAFGEGMPSHIGTRSLKPEADP